MMGRSTSLNRCVLDGSEVLIWDDLFSADFVTSLYTTLNNAEYDSLPGKKAYRSWICPFEVEDFSEHPLFLRTCEALTQEHSNFRPRCLSAHAQILTFGDFVPLEASHHEGNVKSILYFANSEWCREWAAETVLFPSDGGAAVAISPEPGRVVSFKSSQTRRLGVPSRLTHLTSVVVQFEVELE